MKQTYIETTLLNCPLAGFIILKCFSFSFCLIDIVHIFIRNGLKISCTSDIIIPEVQLYLKFCHWHLKLKLFEIKYGIGKLRKSKTTSKWYFDIKNDENIHFTGRWILFLFHCNKGCKSYFLISWRTLSSLSTSFQVLMILKTLKNYRCGKWWFLQRLSQNHLKFRNMKLFLFVIC